MNGRFSGGRGWGELVAVAVVVAVFMSLVGTVVRGDVNGSRDARPQRSASPAPVTATHNREPVRSTRLSASQRLVSGEARMAASRVSLGEGFPSCLPIPLEHVRASDAAAAFRKRWPEATITVNAGQNFVVITRAPSSQLRTMKSFVEALDRQAPSR